MATKPNQQHKAVAASAPAQAQVQPQVQPQSQAQPTPAASFVQVELKTMDGVTAENFTTFKAADLIKGYGNKSNAIRGLAALGVKPGPISKHLEIRYQHARNVLSRPLKRVIKEQRDAGQQQAAPAGEQPAAK